MKVTKASGKSINKESDTLVIMFLIIDKSFTLEIISPVVLV